MVSLALQCQYPSSAVNLANAAPSPLAAHHVPRQHRPSLNTHAMTRGASSLRKLFDKPWSVQDLIIILFDLVGKQGKVHANKVRQSTSFWTNLFIYTGTNTERCAKGAICNVIAFTVNWMHACHFDVPAQLRPFVELCLKADLFAVLDPAVPRVASMRGVAMQLTRIICCVENIAMAVPSLLQHQLPRRTRCSCWCSWTRVPRGLSEFARRGTLRRGTLLKASTFNPPSRAHVTFANAPQPTFASEDVSDVRDYDAQLLLSVRNMDKQLAPGDATHAQPLEMLLLFARDILRIPAAAAVHQIMGTLSPQPRKNVAVAIIQDDEPTFVGKSTVLLRTPTYGIACPLKFTPIAVVHWAPPCPHRMTPQTLSDNLRNLLMGL
ncbi:hypothetical protein FOMPIDRAFT_1052184 [Fomitopsis schrenkii]|uniref:Uncharacterized protein n=1 Tax=Fomitopsis schrenkii TaxID=2126942 RepID=S8E2F2_FOMSC|nr:hypothetical protein FOMPIDRAFT_1052184 [Fomitopsis schrenkii]